MQYERSKHLSTYQCIRKQQEKTSEKQQSLEQTHSLQDLFYIWYRDPFAIINGLWLGMDSPEENISFQSKDDGSIDESVNF